MTPRGRPEVLALIPARGGSKGIPRKNLMTMAGKPLIAHSIEQAKGAKLVTRVLVSSDDAEILEISRRHGAETPFVRPPEFAQDASLDIEVFTHALEWLAAHESYRPDLIVHLRPTEPLRRPADIDRAVRLMLESPEATALKSVSPAHQTPYKMWRMDEGFLRPLLALPGVREPHAMPRQKLPQVYWQNGIIDVIRPETVLRDKTMYGDKVLPLVLEDAGPPLDHLEDIPAVARALEELRAGTAPKAGDEPRSTRYAS